MVVIDFTTRYSVLKPLENKDAESIINVLRDTISHYGSPEILLSDNAAEYKSEALKRFCKFYNINKLEISPYHPQSQGLAERVNRVENLRSHLSCK